MSNKFADALASKIADFAVEKYTDTVRFFIENDETVGEAIYGIVQEALGGRADLDEWIESEFAGSGVALRLETDPPDEGEPFMSMATAKDLTRQAVAKFAFYAQPIPERDAAGGEAVAWRVCYEPKINSYWNFLTSPPVRPENDPWPDAIVEPLYVHPAPASPAPEGRDTK